MIEKFSLIDTNILIYAYDDSEREKHHIAIRLFEKCWKKQLKYAFSIQNLSEYFVNVTKKIEKPISNIEASNNVRDILSFSHFLIYPFGANEVLIALDFVQEYKISYWDALIAAVMKENDISTIITENVKDFKKIPWIEVINPFEE
jgi:predicted nucleic acid-binding protein